KFKLVFIVVKAARRRASHSIGWILPGHAGYRIKHHNLNRTSVHTAYIIQQYIIQGLADIDIVAILFIQYPVFDMEIIVIRAEGKSSGSCRQLKSVKWFISFILEIMRLI